MACAHPPARVTRVLAALVATASALLLTDVGAGAAAPAARDCAPPSYPAAGYFDRVTVTGASCATGSRVALAYYRCRTHAGDPAGRCPGGVLGFRCRELRQASSTQIQARVTCLRGRTRVVHVYSQDLPG